MKAHKLIKKLSTILLAMTLITVTVPAFSGDAVMAETEGVWVLTSTEYYTPSQRTSNSNEYYKYDCSFDGFTQDGAVRFSVSGGYKGPGDWHTADLHHECTRPEPSYAPGETVTLTMTTIQENTVNGYKGGDGVAKICSEDLESPYDGRDRFFNSTTHANFNLDTGSLAIASPNTSCTAYADMPKSAEYGDRVAVMFIDTSAIDSYGSSYELGYGGHQFYEWIYTFMSSGDATAILNQDSNTSGQTTVQGDDTPATAVQGGDTPSATVNQTQSGSVGNLLVNPDWEDGLNGWEKIDSVEEECGDEKVALRSVVYQDINLTSEQEGAKVSFSGMICVNEGQPEQDQIRISLSFYSEDGKLISYDSRTETGYDLTYHEINMAVPLGAAYMKASISIRKYNGNNSFSFDDLSLTISQVSPGGFSKSAG